MTGLYSEVQRYLAESVAQGQHRAHPEPRPASAVPPPDFKHGMNWWREVDLITYPLTNIYVSGYFEDHLVAVTFDMWVVDSYRHYGRNLNWIGRFPAFLAATPGVRRVIRDEIIRLSIHEVDENFEYSGSKIYNPHDSSKRIHGTIY